MPHTPRPWKVICNQDGSLVRDGIVSSVHALKDIDIARVLTGHRTIIVDEGNRRSGVDTWLEGEANARLIAAAPELLEACTLGKSMAMNPLIAAANALRESYPQLSQALRAKRTLEQTAIAKATKGA